VYAYENCNMKEDFFRLQYCIVFCFCENAIFVLSRLQLPVCVTSMGRRDYLYSYLLWLLNVSGTVVHIPPVTCCRFHCSWLWIRSSFRSAQRTADSDIVFLQPTSSLLRRINLGQDWFVCLAYFVL